MSTVLTSKGVHRNVQRELPANINLASSVPRRSLSEFVISNSSLAVALCACLSNKYSGRSGICGLMVMLSPVNDMLTLVSQLSPGQRSAEEGNQLFGRELEKALR